MRSEAWRPAAAARNRSPREARDPARQALRPGCEELAARTRRQLPAVVGWRAPKETEARPRGPKPPRWSAERRASRVHGIVSSSVNFHGGRQNGSPGSHRPQSNRRSTDRRVLHSRILRGAPHQPVHVLQATQHGLRPARDERRHPQTNIAGSRRGLAPRARAQSNHRLTKNRNSIIAIAINQRRTTCPTKQRRSPNISSSFPKKSSTRRKRSSALSAAMGMA